MTATLFILPQGPTIGGVTTWVCQSASALAGAGERVGVLVHGALADHTDTVLPLHPGVTLFTDPALPAPCTLAGAIRPVVDRYADVARQLASSHSETVVLVPTRDADCFTAAARLVASDPVRRRMLGWRHSPMPYEREIFARSAPAMSRLVGVSQHLADELRTLHPSRALDIACVHNAVPVPPAPPSRAPLHARPLRLIYTGRLDEPFKRVEALVHMSDALLALRLPHQLSIIGDGPSQPSLEALASSRPAITLHGPLPPHQVAPALAQADIFVLPSRVEGLSLSALEAMATGCALILARTPSGATDLIGDDEAGMIAGAVPHQGPVEAGHALARAVQSVSFRDLAAIGRRAHARSARLFSLHRFTRALLDQVAHAAATPPSLDAPIESFHDARRPASVPPDAAERMRSCLDTLADRPVVIFGCGAHTRALADVFANSPARIVALSDDDPGTHGQTMLDRPVVAPDELARTGATDLVLSSWMHEDALWARRALFERQGLRVHRLYALRRPA
ncbi:MAG: glycosyltransferase [Phycisphaerales bacterium]|nr:glycosyltransferase [Phycisphaerales bacterium]